jgi:hypothetical protein
MNQINKNKRKGRERERERERDTMYIGSEKGKGYIETEDVLNVIIKKNLR